MVCRARNRDNDRRTHTRLLMLMRPAWTVYDALPQDSHLDISKHFRGLELSYGFTILHRCYHFNPVTTFLFTIEFYVPSPAAACHHMGIPVALEQDVRLTQLVSKQINQRHVRTVPCDLLVHAIAHVLTNDLSKAACKAL